MVLKVLYIGHSPNRVWPKFVKKTTILNYNLFSKLYFPRKQKLINIIHQKAEVVLGDCEENIIPVFIWSNRFL